MSANAVQIEFAVTAAEHKCLQYACVDVTGWADNAVTNRARVAGDEIIEKLLAYCNANDVQMEVGRDNQINQAFELGVVDTAANAQAASEAADGTE